MKTVSIVLCSYNGERFLKTQLDSIVCQTYPIHELIIQDDGSTDHTLDIAREYAAQYPLSELNSMHKTSASTAILRMH